VSAAWQGNRAVAALLRRGYLRCVDLTVVVSGAVHLHHHLLVAVPQEEDAQEIARLLTTAWIAAAKAAGIWAAKRGQDVQLIDSERRLRKAVVYLTTAPGAVATRIPGSVRRLVHTAVHGGACAARAARTLRDLAVGLSGVRTLSSSASLSDARWVPPHAGAQDQADEPTAETVDQASRAAADHPAEAHPTAGDIHSGISALAATAAAGAPSRLRWTLGGTVPVLWLDRATVRAVQLGGAWPRLRRLTATGRMAEDELSDEMAVLLQAYPAARLWSWQSGWLSPEAWLDEHQRGHEEAQGN
jgi:hypothetical protein